MILLLFTLMLLLFSFVFIITKGDIGKPINLILLSMVISLMCAGYQSITNSIPISIQVFWIVIISTMSLCLGAMASSYLTNKKRNKEIKLDYSIITGYANCLILLLFAACTALIVSNIWSFTGGDLSSLSSMAFLYRMSFLSGESMLPVSTRMLFRFVRILMFYYTHNIISNAVAGHSKDNNYFIFIILLILYILQSLVQGQRADLMYLIIGAYMIFIIQYNRSKKNIRIPFKYIFRVIIATLMILILFAVTRTYFGRTASTSTLNYLTGYMGNGILSFSNRLVIANDEKMFLGRSFKGISRSFKQYLNIGDIAPVFGDSYINGQYRGNTYTAFCYYFTDWGITGNIILPFIFAYTMNKWYLDLTHEKDNTKHRVKITLFAYFSEAMFLLLYDEHFFSTKLVFGLFADIIFLIIIDLFIRRVHLSNGKIKFSRKVCYEQT